MTPYRRPRLYPYPSGDKLNRRLDYLLYVAPAKRLMWVLGILAPSAIALRIGVQAWLAYLGVTAVSMIVQVLLFASRKGPIVMLLVAWGPVSICVMTVRWILVGRW